MSGIHIREAGRHVAEIGLPFCPFSRITPDHMERQKEFPVATAAAMFTERLSLAMNQRGQLYKGAPLYQIVADSKNTPALENFDAQMRRVSWAVYRVRRIYNAKSIYSTAGKQRHPIGTDPNKKGTAERCVEKIETFGNADGAIQRLRELAQEQNIEVYQAHELWYAHIRRCSTQYPTTEEFLVAAPAVIETKARYGVERFDEKWQDMSDLYCGHADLPLFASLEFPNPP